MAIYTERVVMVNKDTAKMDNDIYIYKGNRNICIQFKIIDSQFKFRDVNLVDKFSPSHGYVTLINPEGEQIATGKAEIENATLKLTVTSGMIDEDTEVGDYTIVIDLYDEVGDSLLTIPPIYNQLHVLKRVTDVQDIPDEVRFVYEDDGNLQTVNIDAYVEGAEIKTINKMALADTAARQDIEEIKTAYSGVSNDFDQLEKNVNSTIAALDARIDLDMDNLADYKEEVNAQINDINKYKAYKTLNEFGCIGDGVTDDTANFQKAINSGSVIDGQNKYYKITSELKLNSNTDIKNINIIRGFSGGCMLKTSSNTSNIKLNNISLYHNDNTSTGIVLYRAENVEISNCYIETKTGFSIQIEGSKNININRTKINNVQLSDLSLNYTDGIHIYGGSSDIYVYDCDIISGDDAIAITNEFENSSVDGDVIEDYNTIKNIYVNNCSIDTNARVISITSGNERTSKSYFNNININAITANSHGTIYIRKDNQNLSTEISNVSMNNIVIYKKYDLTSQSCYFEDLTNSRFSNIYIESKRPFCFTNCSNVEFNAFNAIMINDNKEAVLIYADITNSYFKNINIKGNNTNVINLKTNITNNVFENFSIIGHETNKSNAITGVGQGNIFINFVLRGEKLNDFYISSTSFLNNIITGFVYYNSTQASNLSTANTVGNITSYITS